MTAQINEALCNVLCHNLCVAIQSAHELGIDTTLGQKRRLLIKRPIIRLFSKAPTTRKPATRNGFASITAFDPKSILTEPKIKAYL